MSIKQIIIDRRSVRNFEKRPVSRQTIAELMEAVRLAPSACNKQPWAFYVVERADKLAGLRSAYNREWFATAPTVIVACGCHSESWHRAADGKDHCDIDVAIAIDHLTLLATEMGLGTCWVCNFDTAAVAKALDLPDDVEPIAMIPIGYAADAVKPDKNRKSTDFITHFID